jgi:hypothetical protein
MKQSAGRAGLIYGVMIALSLAGMWAILSYGEKLKPPHDLAGEWDILPDATTRPSNQTKFAQVTISQSGRFFQLTIPGQPTRSFELISENVAAKQHTMVLDDRKDHQIMISGPDEGTYRLILDDPKLGALTLRRRFDDSPASKKH